MELIGLENGKNNGSLWLSIRDATDRLGLCDFKAVMKGFEDLIDAKLIAMTKDAHFSIKAAESSRARCWRLTWLTWPQGPVGHRHAPHNWLDYQAPAKTPKRKRADRRLRAMARYKKALSNEKIPVRDSQTIEAELPVPALLPVVNSQTEFKKADGNLPFYDVRESRAHAAVTMGSGATVQCANDP